ncbi:UNKNOWN [Stylonychia lemnae]|uniref:Uncharacterized protein n=1 Tax=Stylonychia lemnae TaxID=5949 RepID=A0A078AUN4_STYLE|nr:UNKNOWN [Stylonychia lemnae]|eukprot:CDW84593.1 UNKNOWN [Stylonychia lemnae]
MSDKENQKESNQSYRSTNQHSFYDQQSSPIQSVINQIKYYELYNNPDYVYKDQWRDSSKKKNHQVLRPIIMNDSIFMKSFDFQREQNNSQNEGMSMATDNYQFLNEIALSQSQIEQQSQHDITNKSVINSNGVNQDLVEIQSTYPFLKIQRCQKLENDNQSNVFDYEQQQNQPVIVKNTSKKVEKSYLDNLNEIVLTLNEKAQIYNKTNGHYSHRNHESVEIQTDENFYRPLISSRTNNLRDYQVKSETISNLKSSRDKTPNKLYKGSIASNKSQSKNNNHQRSHVYFQNTVESLNKMLKKSKSTAKISQKTYRDSTSAIGTHLIYQSKRERSKSANKDRKSSVVRQLFKSSSKDQFNRRKSDEQKAPVQNLKLCKQLQAITNTQKSSEKLKVKKNKKSLLDKSSKENQTQFHATENKNDKQMQKLPNQKSQRDNVQDREKSGIRQKYKIDKQQKLGQTMKADMIKNKSKERDIKPKQFSML